MDYQLTKKELRLSKPTRDNFHTLKKIPIVCILDNPNSLFNVGVIIRTCEAFRIEKLVICSENKIDLNSKKVKKTSKGTYKWLKIENHKNILEVIKNFKQSGYSIVSVELTKNSINYATVKYNFPVAFVFGNEIDGIKDEVISCCDYSVHIDMFGMGNSLNVSVSAGIIISDAINKYLKVKKN